MKHVFIRKPVICISFALGILLIRNDRAAGDALIGEG